VSIGSFTVYVSSDWIGFDVWDLSQIRMFSKSIKRNADLTDHFVKRGLVRIYRVKKDCRGFM
jgi:hypothetical protein